MRWEAGGRMGELEGFWGNRRRLERLRSEWRRKGRNGSAGGFGGMW